MAEARPFPLFAAPLEEAVERLERGRCGLCGAEDAERWELAIGADVVAACEGCGTVIAVDADTGASRCSSCGRVNALRLVDGESAACTACLRDGRAALTKDTEFGMVRWEDALRGRTHGVPADSPWLEGVRTTPPNENGWVGVELDSDWLLELTRTPTYDTWQGERWRFCCERPMVYTGPAARKDFSGSAELLAVVEDSEQFLWDDLLAETPGDSAAGVYLFECPTCGRRRGHWDMD